MVPSSGASTTEMKSTWPSVAHCALTLAPSCSTSLFTSMIRCGLFLTVCTPSGVRVVSIRYVGIVGLLRDRRGRALRGGRPPYAVVPDREDSRRLAEGPPGALPGSSDGSRSAIGASAGRAGENRVMRHSARWVVTALVCGLATAG